MIPYCPGGPMSCQSAPVSALTFVFNCAHQCHPPVPSSA
ncbi:unnamed protein product, partial [Staurois parvus]